MGVQAGIKEVLVEANGVVVFHKAAKREREVDAFGVRKK